MNNLETNKSNDRPINPPQLKTAYVIKNPFDDIAPRANV